MPQANDFEEYDYELLEKAKSLLVKVFEYHYGDPQMRAKLNRLQTIIEKLKTLQSMRRS